MNQTHNNPFVKTSFPKLYERRIIQAVGQSLTDTCSNVKILLVCITLVLYASVAGWLSTLIFQEEVQPFGFVAILIAGIILYGKMFPNNGSGGSGKNIFPW